MENFESRTAPRHRGNYDVVIVGAGIVGSMIARELSKYKGRFALIEKEPFSGFGVSRANPSMLHSPLMFPSGPLRIEPHVSKTAIGALYGKGAKIFFII